MDAAALLALRRKARRMEVEVEPGKFVVVEALTTKTAARLFREIRGESNTERAYAVSEVATIGWKGFTESDLIVSGASDLVDFDKSLFLDVIAEHPGWAITIADALMARYLKDSDREAEDEKNSATTST